MPTRTRLSVTRHMINSLRVYCVALASLFAAACNGDRGCKGSLRVLLPPSGNGFVRERDGSRLTANIGSASAVCVVVHTPASRENGDLFPPVTTYKMPVTVNVTFAFDSAEAARQSYGGNDPTAPFIVEAVAANGTVLESREGAVTMPIGNSEATATVSLDGLSGNEMTLLKSVSVRWRYGHVP